jgi:hypothetical protein
VLETLETVRARLTSSTVEVGVFGEVNRGKSTLLNALLGEVVSSMKVTPETAVPLWVERGVPGAAVIHGDGRVEQVDDPAEARERTTQRRRAQRPDEEIARVIQYVDVDWLEPGVRLLDTPGLNDPSLAAEYEALALAELDRVAAAIFVFISPPGIAQDEVRLLRSLGARGVDKAFLVCNFHGSQWNEEEDRRAVRQHILDTVRSGGDGDGSFLGDEVRIFEVSAKAGLQAALAGDESAYADSGVAELRSELESYLAKGVLSRITGRTDELLGLAKQFASDAVLVRIAALQDRASLEAARREHEADVAASERVLEEVLAECDAGVKELERRLCDVLATPFDAASATVRAATRARDLEQVGSRLRMASEAAASQAASLYSHQVTVLEERTRRRLHESFGVERRMERTTSADLVLRPTHAISVDVTNGRPDWGAVGLSAGATAVTGALVGGSLAGGIGIALVAMGPIGWLIGAGAGLVAGGVLGGLGAGVVTRDALPSATKSALADQVELQRGAVLADARSTCSNLLQDLRHGLTSQRRAFFGAKLADLERVEALLDDDSGRRAALEEAQSLLDEIVRL